MDRASPPAGDLAPYDQLLLVSFGGPEAPEEVLPFLQRVTAGRGIPEDRLAEVGRHYFLFGGRSPINDQNRALLAALRAELDRRGLGRVPLDWGNRNSAPLLDDVVPRLAGAGRRRVLALTTSAYPSYSSCRQYRENLYDALARVEGDPPAVDKIRNYATHPGFVAAYADTVTRAVAGFPGAAADPPRLVFVTHSIPTAMAAGSGPSPGAEGEYVRWHREVAAAITADVAGRAGLELQHELTYCSRSGPPSQPWLEPDVNDALEHLAADGVTRVVLVPIGFISDHMEVLYDLDTEATATGRRLGLELVRAASVSDHPRFVTMLVDVMLERAAIARGEQPDQPVIEHGDLGRVPCLASCCPNLRQPDRLAVCQTARP